MLASQRQVFTRRSFPTLPSPRALALVRSAFHVSSIIKAEQNRNELGLVNECSIERGYWSCLQISLVFSNTRDIRDGLSWVKFFEKSLWDVEGGFSTWCSRFVVLDEFLSTSKHDDWSRCILLKFHNYTFLQRAHVTFHAQPTFLYLDLLWQVRQWPLDDHLTTTMEISGLSPEDNEDTIRRQFPYLEVPNRLYFLEQGILPLNIARWECRSNEELCHALETGPVGDTERGQWKLTGVGTSMFIKQSIRREWQKGAERKRRYMIDRSKEQGPSDCQEAAMKEMLKCLYNPNKEFDLKFKRGSRPDRDHPSKSGN